jgi:RHS repeat-associated protein
VAIYYLVDDHKPTGYPQVLEEYRTLPGSYTPASLNRVYNYGLALISQQQFNTNTLLPTATSYYGFDGHGSVRFLMDTNQFITDTYAYDAYGTTVASTGSTPNNYLYCGEQYDSNLGLYYLRARYYKPDTGRFWTMDSFAGRQEEPLSLHRYLYGWDNPVNMDDPSGNVPIVSNFIWGNRVHQKIYDDFLETGFGAQRTANQPMSSILGIPYVPILTAGRPDLVQYPSAGNPGEVYEIKPVGFDNFIEGQVQLQWYLSVLNALDPQKRQWQAGSIGTYTPPSFISLSYGVFAVVSPPVRGVILYYVEDVRLDAILVGAYMASQIQMDVGIAIELNTLAPVM